MTISVLVPTYRRPDDLERCLAGIAAQIRPADQVVAVAREDDQPTWRVLRAWQDRLPLQTVSVSEPGVVHALNMGVEAVVGELVAITDDDAVPRPDWLARIELSFAADPKIAGVGGRDWVHNGPEVDAGQRRLVGRVMWFGRVVGNHHLGVGLPRDVDILKGVNGAYRTELLRCLRLDARLRGQGAQVHWEVALGLELQRRGWRLVYDPEIAVDHYPAARADIDQRGQFVSEATFNSAYNLYWALATHMITGPRRSAALLWQRWIGTPLEPGRIRHLIARLRGRSEVVARARAASAGRQAALRDAVSRPRERNRGRPNS